MLYALNYVYDNDIDKFPTWIGVHYCDYVHLSLSLPWKEMILSLSLSYQVNIENQIQISSFPHILFFNFPESFPTLKDEFIAICKLIKEFNDNHKYICNKDKV